MHEKTRTVEAHKSDTQLTRVHTTTSPQMADLQQWISTPQQVQLQNNPTNDYNLRSRKILPWNAQPNFRHSATQHLTALSLFQPFVNHIYRPNGKKETIDTLLQGSDQDLWLQSLSRKWGRLMQGNNKGVLATNTIDFIT